MDFTKLVRWKKCEAVLAASVSLDCLLLCVYNILLQWLRFSLVPCVNIKQPVHS